MTIEVGSGGGVVLTMPSISTVQTAAISLKDGAGTVEFIHNAGFWSVIDISHTTKGYETVSLSGALSTLAEQTVVDISGQAGVLTHVISPCMNGNQGIMTIRVTADGVLTEFISGELGSSSTSRYSIGNFVGGRGISNPNYDSGLTGYSDSGFAVSADYTTLITPVQSLILGGTGIVFKNSLKVTIQPASGSGQTTTGLSSTAQQNKAAACYSISIPKGL